MLKAFSIEYKPLGTKYHKNVSLNLVIPNFRRNFANANGKNCNNASCFLQKIGV